MEKQGNPYALFKTCKEFQEFKSLNDDLFINDLLLMLFSAYKNLLTNKLSKRSEEKVLISLQTIRQLQNQLTPFETENMLHTIDILTKELELLIDEPLKTKLIRQVKKSIKWGSIAIVGFLLYNMYYNFESGPL